MATPLERLLVESGILTPEAAESALRRHLDLGVCLDTVLLEEGVDERALLLALAQASELPAAYPIHYATLDPKATQVFPYKLAERHGWVPIGLGKRYVDVAVCYPVDKILIEETSFMLGRDLRPQISVEVRIREAIARHYKRPLQGRFSALAKKLGPPPEPAAKFVNTPTYGVQAVLQAPIVAAPEPARPKTVLTPAAPGFTVKPSVRPPSAPSARPAQQPPPLPPPLSRTVKAQLPTQPAPPAPVTLAAPRPPLPQEAPPPPPPPPVDEQPSPFAPTPRAEGPAPVIPQSTPLPVEPESPFEMAHGDEEDVKLDHALIDAMSASATPWEPPRAQDVPASLPPLGMNVQTEPSPFDAPLLESLPVEEGEQDVQVLDGAFGDASPVVAHPPAPEPPPFPVSRPEEALAGSLLVDEPEALSQFPEPPPYPTSDDDLLLPPGDDDGFEELVYAPDELEAADVDTPLPPTRTVSVPVLDLGELHAGRVRPAAPEDVRKFIAWEVSAETSSSIEEALSAAYDRAQREIEPVPEEHFDDASQLAAGVLPEPTAAPLVRKIWSLTEARHRLSVAPGRDEILAVALEFALKSFDFAAALAVRSGTAFGWQAMHADGHEDLSIHQVALPLDAPSVLRTVLRARGRYLGPLPDDAQTQKLLRDLDREAPRAALIYPVFVRERPVAFFYADRGHRHVAAPKVAEFLLFAQELSTAFERAILRQKSGPPAPVKVEAMAPLLPSAAPATPPAVPVAEAPAPAAPRPALPQRPVLSPQPAPPLARPTTPALGTPDLARSPTQPNFMVRVTPPRPVRAAAAPEPGPAFERAPTEVEVELDLTDVVVEAPPPSKPMSALIDDLLQPDRKKRAAAQRELERVPSLAAPALAARFPGPTPFRRGLVGDLPEPDEMGPIAGALARLKGAAVGPLARLLVEGDPDARFFAALLAGWLAAPELLPGLRRCLFDPVAEVAAAARAAAVPFRKKLPGFEEGIAHPLRDELASLDSQRVSRAALALGRVRDVQSIPLLIPLTGHAEDRVAMDAAAALTEVTLQTLGDSPRRWAQWFESNRRHPRERWLVDGLSHPDLAIRLTAIGELVDEASDTFGYAADGPRGDRARAIERWDQWLRHREARGRGNL